jgi:signal transduction histidine kinase
MYFIGKENYLLFHTITELTTIILGVSLMLITFGTFKICKDNYFYMFAIIFSLTGVVDLFHTLTYKGINIFSNDSNMPTQLWILGRYFECIMLNISLIYLRKKFNWYKVFGINALIVSLFLLSIIVFKVFPDCYIEGFGLTTFKRISEYIIAVGFSVLLFRVVKSDINIDKENKSDLVKGIFLKILCSLSFTLYVDVYGIFNLLGHLFNLLSYYYCFKIILKYIVVNPYSVLFQNLNNKVNELEQVNKELMKAKDKVQSIEEFHSKFIEFVPAGIVVIRDWKIESVNNIFLNMFEIDDKNEIINENILKIIDISYHTILIMRINNISMLELPQQYQFVWGEKKKMVEVTSLIVKDESGEYIISTITNIEDRKKAEEAEQLLKLKKKEEIMKNDFFTNISHELRTPINLIYSALQVENDYLKNDVNKEVIIRYNKIIRQNCLRLIRLTNNIIDITRIETGFFKPIFSVQNIVAVVEEITMSIVEYVEGKKFTLVFDTEIEEAYVMCDPELIERIMMNILSNAVKYGKEGGNIEVYIDKSTSNSISIFIKDDGIGIPAEMKEKIFDRFLKIDTSLSRNTEGSGIGLAIVKELVEIHKGSITYKSELDHGTEFKITLPILEYASEICSTLEKPKNYEKTIIESVEIEFSDIYD